MNRTFLFEQGTIFLTCCLKAGIMLAPLLTWLWWKISNAKRTNKCLDEVGSKYIQQHYYYEEISFFGEKKKQNYSAQHQQKLLSFLILCKEWFTVYKAVVSSVSWYKLCWLDALPQQYVVKYILIKKKTLSGLAQILLAL